MHDSAIFLACPKSRSLLSVFRERRQVSSSWVGKCAVIACI